MGWVVQQYRWLVTVLMSLFTVACGGTAWAENVPPPDYGANDFVDGEGCLFNRADLAGWTVWVQRLDDERNPVCGLEPTRLEGVEKMAETAGTRT